jgi:hypothetical protein
MKTFSIAVVALCACAISASAHAGPRNGKAARAGVAKLQPLAAVGKVTARTTGMVGRVAGRSSISAGALPGLSPVAVHAAGLDVLGTKGNGLVGGVSALGARGTGNGIVGAAVLSGAQSGNGLVGIGALSGQDAGKGAIVGVGVLNQGSTARVTLLGQTLVGR